MQENSQIDISIGRKLAETSVILLLVYALFFAAWTILFTETGNGDNVEHIHATWLVAHGKMPYRDFFQHHNPLLWYVFAPFITFTTNILVLLDTAHTVGVIGGILTFFVVYKICTRFFGASFIAASLSLLTLCPPSFYIYCFNYNPDTFMALFYAIGLYALFLYWEKPVLMTLCLAFTSFFVAFLFTQKVLMIFSVLGVLSLVVFYKKKAPVTDLMFALLPSVCGVLLFVAYLYRNDALAIYWQSNYPFNVQMQEYYGFRKIDVMDYQRLIPSAILASISIVCFFKNANRYFRIISILFAIELPLRCFYFAISPYYMLPLMIYMVCLNSALFEKTIKKHLLLAYAAVIGASYYAYISIPSYLAARGQDRTFATYLAQNITPCDYLISSFFGNQSLIAKDPHYYWSMLGHIDVLGDEMKIKPRPNLTELVEQYKPKLIFGGPYWNSFYWHRGQDVLWQYIAPEVIDKYYLPTPFPDFYILKYEYRGKNCRYNKQKREWLYAN